MLVQVGRWQSSSGRPPNLVSDTSREWPARRRDRAYRSVKPRSRCAPRLYQTAEDACYGEAMTTASRLRATPEDASLLDVLIDGFEKNEVLRGFHWRTLPASDEAAAIEKYEQFVAEARAWKGTPLNQRCDGPRRVTQWRDLEIRQLGRGVMVLVRAPRFSDWWHDEETWRGDPFGSIYQWLDEESAE